MFALCASQEASQANYFSFHNELVLMSCCSTHILLRVVINSVVFFVLYGSKHFDKVQINTN